MENTMHVIMENRYSCRRFKNEKIKDGVVRDIIDLTRLSPSSLGLEPWKFVIYSKESDMKALGEICHNQTQVSTASHAVIIMARNDLRSDDLFLKDAIRKKGLSKERAAAFEKMIAGSMDYLSGDEIFAYASLQCYLALGNLVNIAYSKGVKSCIIGGFDKEKLKRFINLGSNFRPAILVALGLSDEKSPKKIRQSLDEVMVWK